MSPADRELLDEQIADYRDRELNDGRRFRVVKVFYEPAELAERLRRLGWRADVRSSGEFFAYGCVRAD